MNASAIGPSALEEPLRDYMTGEGDEPRETTQDIEERAEESEEKRRQILTTESQNREHKENTSRKR